MMLHCLNSSMDYTEIQEVKMCKQIKYLVKYQDFHRKKFDYISDNQFCIKILQSAEVMNNKFRF